MSTETKAVQPWEHTGEFDRTPQMGFSTTVDAVGKDSETIAIVYGETKQQVEERARLIAAAPEMGEALQQLDSEIRDWQNVPSLKAMEMVRAALKKAGLR